MRLYVQSPECGKVYLSLKADFRYQLPQYIEIKCKNNSTRYFQNYDVVAEPDKVATLGGAIIGGLIGALAGPVGILVGGIMGGGIGSGVESQDNEAVRRFNSS